MSTQQTSNQAANQVAALCKKPTFGDAAPSATVARALIHPDTGAIVAYVDKNGKLVNVDGVELLGVIPFRVSATITKALPATGSIVFSGQPTAGQIITIDDGTNPPVQFEFDADVTIGATANDTATALHTAINAATLDITSTNSPAGTCALAADAAGASVNVTITEDASNVTVTGMSGGTDSPGVNGTEPASLVADADVPAGMKAYVQAVFVRVKAATAWADASTLTIQYTDGVDIVTIAQAALTGSAKLLLGSSNVTQATGFYTGTTAGVGIEAILNANEETGSDTEITLFGVFAP